MRKLLIAGTAVLIGCQTLPPQTLLDERLKQNVENVRTGCIVELTDGRFILIKDFKTDGSIKYALPNKKKVRRTKLKKISNDVLKVVCTNEPEYTIYQEKYEHHVTK